jgi:hypothetical protein
VATERGGTLLRAVATGLRGALVRVTLLLAVATGLRGALVRVTLPRIPRRVQFQNETPTPPEDARERRSAR